jgi:hypothetical protein
VSADDYGKSYENLVRKMLIQFENLFKDFAAQIKKLLDVTDEVGKYVFPSSARH